MAFLTGPVAVRVPATSANLGPGFDALGLALTLYDDVRARVVAGGGVRVTVAGEGAGELPTDDRHLVVRTMKTTFASSGPLRPASNWRAATASRRRGASDRRRPRSWPASCSPGRWSKTAPRISTTRRSCGWPPRSRGIPTTSRRACSAA